LRKAASGKGEKEIFLENIDDERFDNGKSLEISVHGLKQLISKQKTRPSCACTRLITLWIQVNTDGRIVFPKNFIHPIPDAALCPIGVRNLKI